jgi:hypothetical protein
MGTALFRPKDSGRTVWDSDRAPLARHQDFVPRWLHGSPANCRDSGVFIADAGWISFAPECWLIRLPEADRAWQLQRLFATS